MSDSLFREGGPHRIKRVGRDRYHIGIDTDANDGMVGRECQSCETSYFKVKLGTGITEGQTVAFCPYCRQSAEPGDFLTAAQGRHALDIAMNEAQHGVEQMIKKAFGLGPTGQQTFGGGFLSMKMSYKPGRRRAVGRLVEEELRRDVRCPHCDLEHAVFGLAFWCADCGVDIFLTHVETEFEVVRKMLAAVESRRKELGPRVAARDIENSLEDTVSIFEGVLKAIIRRELSQQGKDEDEVEEILTKRVGNRLQNVKSAGETFRKVTGTELFEEVPEEDVAAARLTFEKRHLVTHNLGVVDRKYLNKAESRETEGREVRLDSKEVSLAIDFAYRVISNVYVRMFPSDEASSTAAS